MDELRHIHRDRLKRLSAREGEKPLNERFGSVGGLRRAIDKPLLALATYALTLKHVESADDGCQQVVEVVCYAARKLAHRLHFLALSQRCLCCFSFRDCELNAGLERRIEFA